MYEDESHTIVVNADSSGVREERQGRKLLLLLLPL